jgi:hypothetical protein
MSKYTPFIKEAIKSLPREAKIVRRVYRDMRDADYPIVRVWDGVESEPVKNMTELMELVFNLDEAWLMTREREWVRITLGNGWDALTDYTTGLEHIISHTSKWIEEQELKEDR